MKQKVMHRQGLILTAALATIFLASCSDQTEQTEAEPATEEIEAAAVVESTEAAESPDVTNVIEPVEVAITPVAEPPAYDTLACGMLQYLRVTDRDNTADLYLRYMRQFVLEALTQNAISVSGSNVIGAQLTVMLANDEQQQQALDLVGTMRTPFGDQGGIDFMVSIRDGSAIDVSLTEDFIDQIADRNLRHLHYSQSANLDWMYDGPTSVERIGAHHLVTTRPNREHDRFSLDDVVFPHGYFMIAVEEGETEIETWSIFNHFDSEAQSITVQTAPILSAGAIEQINFDGDDPTQISVVATFDALGARQLSYLAAAHEGGTLVFTHGYDAIYSLPVPADGENGQLTFGPFGSVEEARSFQSTLLAGTPEAELAEVDRIESPACDAEGESEE